MIAETIIFIATLALSYSLVPQLFRIWVLSDANQFSWQFTIITFIGITAIAIAMIDLELYWAAVANFFTAGCYGWIIAFKIIFRSR